MAILFGYHTVNHTWYRGGGGGGGGGASRPAGVDKVKYIKKLLNLRSLDFMTFPNFY